MIHGIIAIIGRPNVGKSTLFNRLTSSDAAIVDDQPGVTRDRLYGTAWTDDNRESGFMLVDTGGFETDDFKFQPFAENLVWRQTEQAIEEADLVLLLVDAKAGLNPHDRQLHRHLETTGKPHIIVVNKVDGPEQEQSMWEFYELGAGDLAKVSAAHNRGVSDLKELLETELKALPHLANVKTSPNATRIAIVGRPNAGKSSILNRLTGEDRALVSEIAGTTRDSLDTPMMFNNREYVLVDTAGIRRKSRIDEKLESMSVVRSLRAIDRADVVLLIVDAMQGMTEQDARLADLAAERGKPLVIVVNKWDLFPNKETNSAKEYTEAIYREAKSISFAPVIFVSALENQRVHKLMTIAERLSLVTRERADTSKVNEALKDMVLSHTPALIRGKTKRVKFFFATQVAIAPPTVVVFCNVAREIQESYIRYMTHKFRAALGFDEIPIRLIFRPKALVRKRDQALAEAHEAREDERAGATVKSKTPSAQRTASPDDFMALEELDFDDDELVVESDSCSSTSPTM